MTEAQITVLQGLEGNEPTHLTGLQLVLLPHLDLLQALWATLFVATLCLVALRHIFIPLFKRKFQ